MKTQANLILMIGLFFLMNGCTEKGAVQTLFDCPELELNITASCDDENPHTLNDRVLETCECKGDDAYECMRQLKNIGDNCDDGNEDTVYDTVTADCSCKGLPKDSFPEGAYADDAAGYNGFDPYAVCPIGGGGCGMDEIYCEELGLLFYEACTVTDEQTGQLLEGIVDENCVCQPNA